MTAMTDKLMDMYHRYYNQFMTWYNSSSDLVQYATLIGGGIVVFLVVALFFLSRITR